MKDLEASLFIRISGLEEIKNKKYSALKTSERSVYIFRNYNEFKTYFIKNSCTEVDDESIKMCILKITKKGSIIAFKSLCDNCIKRYRIYKMLPYSKIQEIHKLGKITFFEKVKEWVDNGICAPESVLRCNEFNNCYECLREYAASCDEYDKIKIKK